MTNKIKVEVQVLCQNCGELMIPSDTMTLSENGTQSREYKCSSPDDEACNSYVSVSLKFSEEKE